jgi:hypothetical protein
MEATNKGEYLVHIPTSAYEFVEVKVNSPEEAKEVRDSVIAAFLEPKTTPNSGLKPVDLLRLLYKRLCNQGLQIEETESLGTDKIYSQKDVHKIIESLVAKAKREEGTNRINKEEDVRYDSETYTNHYNDLKRD